MYASGSPRASIEAGRRKAGYTSDTAKNVSCTLYTESKVLYRVQSTTDAAVQVLRDSLVTIMSVKSVSKVANGAHALRPTTTTGTEAPPDDAHTEAVTDGETTIPMLGAVGSVQGDGKEFIISELVGHRRANRSMQYHA